MKSPSPPGSNKDINKNQYVILFVSFTLLALHDDEEGKVLSLKTDATAVMSRLVPLLPSECKKSLMQAKSKAVQLWRCDHKSVYESPVEMNDNYENEFGRNTVPRSSK
ncbi:hypothetical protein PoB_004961700 [Plakobranchus ocellatus]|uniref:Uncharacterized protein n=1 Tax=Plakobranchus ocellatus TaxID=259542 RepID=A0AAV4BUV3_9GAST|nr:hypothetical protein PoB_004961700 [Plakobranchus ocellatus]